jgi:hypothetical protein
MIYTHYQKINFKLAISNTTYVKIYLSDDNLGKGHSIIKNHINRKEMDHIVAMFKQVPSSRRDYDPGTQVWTFEGTAILQLLELYYIGAYRNFTPAHIKAHMLIENQDMDKFLKPTKKYAGDPVLDWDDLKAKVEAEVNHDDFFRQPVSTDTRTPASIDAQLRSLIGVTDAKVELTKKMYLQAVRKYHPDMGGDAKKMSELNELWTIYNNK